MVVRLFTTLRPNEVINSLIDDDVTNGKGSRDFPINRLHTRHKTAHLFFELPGTVDYRTAFPNMIFKRFGNVGQELRYLLRAPVAAKVCDELVIRRLEPRKFGSGAGRT